MVSAIREIEGFKDFIVLLPLRRRRGKEKSAVRRRSCCLKRVRPYMYYAKCIGIISELFMTANSSWRETDGLVYGVLYAFIGACFRCSAIIDGSI